MNDFYLLGIAIMGSILVLVLFYLNDFDVEKTMFEVENDTSL